LQTNGNQTKRFKYLNEFGAGKMKKTKRPQLLLIDDVEHGGTKFWYMREKVQDAIGNYEFVHFFLMLQRLLNMLLIVEHRFLTLEILSGKACH
jgi:hypothetical protein